MKYLVVGSGRWAKHLKHLLELSNAPHSSWSRRSPSLHNNTTDVDDDFKNLVQEASHIWLAVSDSAIEEIATKVRHINSAAVIIHSSGALEIPQTESVHPLMTFSHTLYPEDIYINLQLVTTSKIEKEKLIPYLKQNLSYIDLEKKAYYHALCVLAGNGSVLLWQKFFREMKNFGISELVSIAYFKQIAANIESDLENALTGPLVRNDRKTLLMDLDSMNGDPYQAVLQSLIQAFHQTKMSNLK